MTNDIIKIEQLPIITQQLKKISTKIDTKVKKALSLVCTDETVVSVKKVRAELNKESGELDTKRKEIKKAVLAPYEEFENIFKELVSDKFRDADSQLKNKVDDVENSLKKIKQSEVEEYYAEYAQSKNMDIPYNRAGINITLSESLKKLKEQAKAFIDKISEDYAFIETQEHKEEILVEYHNCLNIVAAMSAVQKRHELIEAQKYKSVQVEEKKAAEEIIVNKVEELLPPDEIIKCKFTVEATKTKLKRLIEFMKEEGIKYE